MPITYLDEEEEDFTSPLRPVPLTQKKPSKVTYLDEEPIVQQAASRPKTWKLPASSPFAKEEEIEEEGFFRQAADIPVGLAKGAAQGVRSFTDILGADNPVSQSIRGVEDYLGNLMSAQAKEDQAEIARIMQDAQDKGVLDQVMAGVKAFSVAPVDLTVQALGTMAPVIAGGLAANVAKVAATGIRGGVAAARGLTAGQMAATQAGIGAGMGAGVVKGTIYDEVKNELLSQGLSEDAAHQQAVKAQEYGGKNLDQILLGAGLGAAAATTGAEKIIGGILTKTGVGATKSRVANALKAGVTEAFPEAAQGAQEQLAANLALQREGMEVPTTRGVFSAGALEGIAGFGVGAPLGAIQKASVAEDAARKAEEANAPQTAAAIRAAGQKAATTEKDISATEQAIEETEAATQPTVPIREEEPFVQPPKEEFKAAFAKMTPESIAETEANFREQLQSEDEETRVFSQNALDALAEFRAEQAKARPLPTDVLPTETPGATYGREADIYDVFANVRRRPMPPSGPAFESAQVIEEAARRADILRRTPEGRDLLRRELQGEEMVGGVRRATEEALATAPEPAEGDVFAGIRRPSRAEEAAITIEQQLTEDERIRRSQLGAEALREELAQAESLSRVADNTATDEEVVRLARQGLVNIQDGQNIITPRGEEVMQRGGAPLPRLTPEERAAEVAAAPAIVEQAPTVKEGLTAQPAPPIEERVIDTRHLEALELGLSNARIRASEAKTAQEKAARDLTVRQYEKEIDQEKEFLGIKEEETPKTDEELLAELGLEASPPVAEAPAVTPAPAAEVAPAPVTPPQVTEVAPMEGPTTETVPSRNWELYSEELLGDLEAFSPARITGRTDYDLMDVATRFIEFAKKDTSGKPLSKLVSDFGKADLYATTSQIKKLRTSVKSIEQAESAAAPAPVTPPPAAEAPAPEVAPAAPAEAAPVGIAVGNRVKTKTTPQSFVVEEVLPQSAREAELGEQYYSIRNERTGETQVVEASDISPIKGKRTRKVSPVRAEEKYAPVPEANRYTFREASGRAIRFFGGEKPENFVIVNNSDDPDYEFKAGYDPETGEIILNRAYIRKGENIEDILTHELGHYIYSDPQFQADFQDFLESMPDEARAEIDRIVNEGYNKETNEVQIEEREVMAFTSLIRRTKRGLTSWEKLKDTIKKIINRFLGTNIMLSDQGAMAVFNVGYKRFKSGERIIREMREGVLKMAPEPAPAPEAVVEEAPAERPKRRTKMQNIIDISTGVKRPKTKLTVNEMTALKDQIKMRARRRREDKRSQREFAEELTKEIREMTIRGKVRPAQLRAIMSVALRTQFDNEASINAFNKYADKVIENANYEKDISDALSTIKRAKQLSKGKKGSSRIRHRLAELARFNPRDIEPESMEPKRVEIDGEIVLEKPISVAEYTAVLKEYMGSLGPVTAEGFRVIPEAEIVDFLERMAAQYDANVEERRKAAFAKKLQQALENKALLPSELESITKDSPEEYEQNLKKKQEDKRLKIENAITDLAMDAQSALVTYQPPEMTADKKEVLDFMRAVNVGDIPAGERKEFVLVANNILVNNDFSGSQKFTSIAKGQIGAMKAAEDAKSVKRNDAMLTFLDGYISEKLTRAINLSIQSVADTFRNIAGKEGAPRLLFLMGMGDLARGQANANKLNDEIANGIRDRYTQIEEETGQQISDKQGMFSMGVAGTLIQIQPDETEAEGISRIRKLILENIAVMENSPLLEDRRNVAFVKKALAEVDADSVDGILENLNRLHPANYKALDFLMNTVLPAQKEMLKEHDELFNNQTDNYNNPFYLPIRYRRTMVPIRTPEDIITSIYGGTPAPKQAANTIKRQKYSTLPRDVDGAPMLFDFNLTKNVLDSLSSQITAAYTNAYWQQIVSFLKAPPASDAVGGTRNLSFVNERLGKLAQSRTRRAYEMDGVSRILDTVANISRRLGIGLALGGYGQFIKQLPDQLMTTLVNVKDPQLISDSMADLLSGRANAVLRQFSIGERGEIAGGTTWTNQMEGNFDKVRRFINNGNWVKAADAFERFNNVWLFALKKSDYLAAGSGWLAYYRKYLRDRGAEFKNWDEEATLLQEDNQLRIEAALYAEQMVDMYQGSSDPTKMATLSQRGQNGWENLAKTIFIPFFSFVIQQRSRIFSDARDIAFGDSDQKKSGASGMAGTLLGILAFHSARRFALPALAGVGASAIYALLGVDMDEPDEEKQKEEANRIWRQFSGEVLSNIFFGGFGDFTEKKFIDSVNYASYLIEVQIGNENVLNDKGELISFDKYQKERSPLYRYTGPGSENNLGMLDIMPGQIGELKKRIEEMTDEELAESLTPEERRVLFVAGLSEWLYTMRLNDADIARMIRRMNKDVIEQAEEREKARKRLQEIYK